MRITLLILTEGPFWSSILLSMLAAQDSSENSSKWGHEENILNTWYLET